MSSAKIPVFLLAGFLGSGKTTLLNSALRLAQLANTAVVVNEMGTIGLDHLIIAQASDNVTLLEAGCLCCVNTGALHETLAELTAQRARGEIPAFERVIIETSGVADPAPLLNVLLGHPLLKGQYELEATVCVVDAQHFLPARSQYAVLDKQAALADRIVLSKTDLADPAQVRVFLAELNPHAELFAGPTAAAAFFPCGQTLRPARRIATLGPLRARGESSAIRAYSFRPPSRVTWAGWSAWSQLVAAGFGERLLRVKGLLRLEDGGSEESGEIVFVQGVQGVFHPPQRLPAWPDTDHTNRLVCISRDLRETEIQATLPALNTAPGIQAHYSLNDLPERQAPT